MTCALGLMGHANRGNDAKASVEVTVLAERPGVIAGEAEVASASLAMELIPENNRSAAKVDVVPLAGPRPAADLVLELTAPRTARRGRRFAYTARVVNLGPDRADGVRLGSRSVGELGVGEARPLRLTTVAKRRGTLWILAAVTSATPDPTAASNRARAAVRVR